MPCVFLPNLTKSFLICAAPLSPLLDNSDKQVAQEETYILCFTDCTPEKMKIKPGDRLCCAGENLIVREVKDGQIVAVKDND